MSNWHRFIYPWLLLAVPLVAQSQPHLTDGDRVRVTYRCRLWDGRPQSCPANGAHRVVTGQLVSLDPDTLRVRPEFGGTPLVFPRSTVVDLKLSEGKQGHFLAGAGIGLVAGAALGAAIGSTQEWCMFSCSPMTEAGLIAGAPAGLLLGGIVGALLRTDRWTQVDLHRPRVSVMPRLDVVGVTVSIAF